MDAGSDDQNDIPNGKRTVQWGEKKKRVESIERNLFPLSEFVSEQAGE